MAQSVQGQPQPAPGLLEVWELAHARRLWQAGRPDLTPGSAFPQESLNLLLCERDWRRDRQVAGG